ncbi:MAG: CHAP domain-containing protein [Candidatus Moranbacteria bacterium]|nr:CHAP domain-containing protein [Candidatus Moranbacteria bacterium]
MLTCFKLETQKEEVMKRLALVLMLTCICLLHLSGNVFAFEYSGSMTKGGYTYTDYFIARSASAGTYIGVFYNSECYGTNHVTNVTHQFNPSCSTGGYVWYGTSCNVNMESCGYSNRFSVGYGYINSVFSDSGGGNYVLSTIYTDWSTSRDIYSSGGSHSLILANTVTPPAQLTIVVDPLEGGNVTGSGISCNVDENSTCQYSISQILQASLEANANEGYAFGHWLGIENPHAITPSESTTITAKFFKTFRNAAGSFRKAENETGGWCLNYVEYETDLPDGVCTYSAINCFAQANVKGYATGKEPRAGAIIAFAQTDTMPNGHVGIVTSINESAGTMSIHDSNLNEDGIVHDHTVNINNSDILGYIYYTP